MNNKLDNAVASEYCEEGAVAETVRVCIPSLTRYISVARQAVDAVTEQIHLPADDRMAVRLAVGEACNNAVFHATHHRADKVFGHVVVACRICRDALEIDVANQGGTFAAPAIHGEAAMPEALAEHGRGIALMEMLMDSVEYLAHDGGTVVRMRKHRDATSENGESAVHVVA